MGRDSSSSSCDEQKDDIVRRLAVLALAPVRDVAPLRKDWEILSAVTLEPMLLLPSCSIAHSLWAVTNMSGSTWKRVFTCRPFADPSHFARRC